MKKGGILDTLNKKYSLGEIFAGKKFTEGGEIVVFEDADDLENKYEQIRDEVIEDWGPFKVSMAKESIYGGDIDEEVDKRFEYTYGQTYQEAKLQVEKQNKEFAEGGKITKQDILDAYETYKNNKYGQERGKAMYILNTAAERKLGRVPWSMQETLLTLDLIEPKAFEEGGGIKDKKSFKERAKERANKFWDEEEGWGYTEEAKRQLEELKRAKHERKLARIAAGEPSTLQKVFKMFKRKE